MMSPQVDKTYIGVMEINFSTTGADSLTASFYNEAGGLAGSQGFTGLDLDANMSHIAMGIAGNYNNNVFVDEIRYGTELSDVFNPIPEPSSAALIGLGSLVLLRRRRA